MLYVTKAIKNGDSYTLKGVIFTRYTLSDSQLESVKEKGTIRINNMDYDVKNPTTQSETGFTEYEVYGSDPSYPAFKIKQLDSATFYLECQAQIIDACTRV